MKKVKKVLIYILIIVVVLGSLIFFDYFYTKTNNVAPKISLKSDLDENTVVYKAVLYKVWYCKNSNTYYIGDYNDKDAICPKKYTYVYGYYINDQDVRISKRDLQLLTNDGLYTSEMVENMKDTTEVENAVYVAYNYGIKKYKEEGSKSSKGYNLVLLPEFKEDNTNFKWIYDESKKYCLKTDKNNDYLADYVNDECGEFVKIKMDQKWCENYKNSTLKYDDNIEKLCKE